jgi:hypothetical protein
VFSLVENAKRQHGVSHAATLVGGFVFLHMEHTARRAALDATAHNCDAASSRNHVGVHDERLAREVDPSRFQGTSGFRWCSWLQQQIAQALRHHVHGLRIAIEVLRVNRTLQSTLRCPPSRRCRLTSLFGKLMSDTRRLMAP